MLENSYKGKPCFMSPFLINIQELEKAKKLVIGAFAEFLDRHLEMGKDIELLKIKPVLEEINKSEFEKFLGFNCFEEMYRLECYYGEDIHDIIKKYYRKCIVTFEYKDDECVYF